MTDCCPTCGATRTAADRDCTSVVWHCPTCGVSRESFEGESDE